MDSQDFPNISSSNSAHKLPHKLSHGQKSLGNGHPFATHCPTKIQVKGSQSHCHPRRHHYHHQPAEFTWKAMLVLDALCKGQRFAMICIWCKIHKCPPNPQIAKLSNALPVFPRVCLSASVSDKRQEHIVQLNLAAESAIGSGNCYSDGMISSTRKSEIHGESFSAFTRPVLVWSQRAPLQ